LINAQIASGSNPNESKHLMKSKRDFGTLFGEYIERHAKIHKKTWKTDVGNFKRYLSHWKNKKLNQVDKSDVHKLHTKLGTSIGRYTANRVLELLSTVYNCAMNWGYITENPTVGIKHFYEKSRDRFLQPDEIPRLFKSLENEPNHDIRDYIYISLFTGARKSNVLSMQWNEINFYTKVWRIPETKNGESVSIPLTTEAIKILKDRKKVVGPKSTYVFPSKTSKTGHLVEPKTGWARILKRANISNLRIHDLRRSLGSWQASTGASLSIIGKTLGHKNINTTSIYARLNLDPVRESIQLATQAMIKAGKSNITEDG
jgi:integrase